MKVLVSALFVLILSVAQAQSVKIHGSVLDSLEGTVPGATVMLVGAQDSILKVFTVTDKNGMFVLPNVKPNDYLFKVSYFGYAPYTQELSISNTSNDTVIGKIQLKPKMLEEVEVKAYFIPIQIKGDTIEYDSRAFNTDQHDAVEELLKQLPGVEVAADGSIKAQGKQVGKILVDGEEFFGDDPTIATKNLPADAVKKVQVFDKQSDMAEFTGVEDGNDVTTINLKLKDSHKRGAFGNLEGGVGKDQGIDLAENRYKVKGNIHYFNKKWQASVIGLGNNVNETGFSIQDYINFQGGIAKLMNNGGLQVGDELALNYGRNNDGYLSTVATGMNFNYKPSKKTTLNGSTFLNRFDNTYRKEIDRTTQYSDSSVQSRLIDDYRNDRLNNKFKLDIEHKIDSSQVINVKTNGSWSDRSYNGENFQENFRSDANLANSFRTNLDQNAQGYDFGGGVDYRKKFRRIGQFMGGGLSYQQSRDNEFAELFYNSVLFSSGNQLGNTARQIQNVLTSATDLEANWMYSHAFSKRTLLQLDLSHTRSSESREKEVNDVVNDLELFNEYFSADGDYLAASSQAELRYRYIKKKFKANVFGAYQNTNMSAQNILLNAQTFQYALPGFGLQWKPKKGMDIDLSYSTKVNLPSLDQLQDLPNNLNPSEIILGNTDLIPEYNHNLELGFDRINQFNFTHFMARVSAMYVQNNITYSQQVNEFLVRELRPENLGSEKGLNSYLNAGASIHAMHMKFSFTNTSSLSSGQVKFQSEQDQYTSLYTESTLKLDNLKKKTVDAQVGAKLSWSNNSYALNSSFNSDFFNWSYFTKIKYTIKKNVILSVDLSHNFYPDFATNRQQLSLNAKVATNLLKSKKLQVFVSGNDLLMQNVGIRQNYVQNIYEEITTRSLSRYFLIGARFAFQSLGAKK